jgi:hypothetical protein
VITERLWQHAMRELTLEQWRHGVDVTIRTWKSTWMPPPAVVLEAAYTAPPPPARQHAIRPSGEFWQSAEQREHVERTVRENPRDANESPLSYIRRIAITAGLMAGEPSKAKPRDPGQEG